MLDTACFHFLCGMVTDMRWWIGKMLQWQCDAVLMVAFVRLWAPLVDGQVKRAMCVSSRVAMSIDRSLLDKIVIIIITDSSWCLDLFTELRTLLSLVSLCVAGNMLQRATIKERESVHLWIGRQLEERNGSHLMRNRIQCDAIAVPVHPSHFHWAN